MQNISAHISEGLSVYNAYNEIGVLDTNFNFIIPIYENMPQEISPRPTTSINLTTENVVTTASLLNLRASNSTWSTSLATLPTGTVLLRIETAKSVVNGYYWDKVMYFRESNVITGYVARDYITQIDDIKTTEELYYTSECAILKNAPGINTEPKKILDSGTELTVIDKLEFTIDNIIWYRVKLTDGTGGYITSNFVRAAITEPTVPTGDTFKIQGNNFITIPGITVDQIDGAITESEVLKTGTKIIISEVEYTVVVLGDTNGDGQITPLDYVKIKNNIMETSALEGPYSIAGDVNQDGLISPLDYVKVKNHIMGVKSINL